MLNRNLRVGSSGEDVKKLQEMLAQDDKSGFRGKATGFYGPLTANAVAKFQMRMGLASTSEGTVGPMTRGFFERACGKGLGMEDGGMLRAAMAGEITAVSASSITVKARDNKERTVLVGASTTIQVMIRGERPTPGSMTDLMVGKMIQAEGVPQSDESLLARMIKIQNKVDDE